MTPITDQITCVKREISMRERVYPNWVERRRMNQEQATREITAMRDVLRTLEAVKAGLETRKAHTPDPLSQGFNEGNGVYRP